MFTSPGGQRHRASAKTRPADASISPVSCRRRFYVSPPKRRQGRSTHCPQALPKWPAVYETDPRCPQRFSAQALTKFGRAVLPQRFPPPPKTDSLRSSATLARNAYRSKLLPHHGYVSLSPFRNARASRRQIADPPDRNHRRTHFVSHAPSLKKRKKEPSALRRHPHLGFSVFDLVRSRALFTPVFDEA